MRFVYTKHVRLRISQRFLSERNIEDTIQKPDRMAPGYKGRSVAQKRFGSKALEVVHKRLNGMTMVITAYWLKEV